MACALKGVRFSQFATDSFLPCMEVQQSVDLNRPAFDAQNTCRHTRNVFALHYDLSFFGQCDAGFTASKHQSFFSRENDAFTIYVCVNRLRIDRK